MFVAGVLAQSGAVVVGEHGIPRALQAAALPRAETRQLPAAAALAALGIVYGDIGASFPDMRYRGRLWAGPAD